MILKTSEISDELKKMMPTSKFSDNTEEITAMAKNIIGAGFGQSNLQKGDVIVGLVGMTVVETRITGNPEPVKYIALVVNVENNDKVRQKLSSFSALLRRKPGAQKMHGIFAEEKFDKCTNYQEVYDVLKENPHFKISDVIRNMEFPTFKASVYETSR